MSLPVRRSVADFLDDFPAVELVTIARLSVEPDSGITVVLSTMEPLVPGFRRKLRQVIAEARGRILAPDFVLDREHDTVRIYVMLEAPYEPEVEVQPDVSGNAEL